MAVVGPPWVAQRVCPMPAVAGAGGVASRMARSPRELARLLDDIQAGGPHQRDARRVVAAVLQTAEAIHENGQGTGGTSFTQRADVADNSTHAPIESCRRGVDNERRDTSV